VHQGSSASKVRFRPARARGWPCHLPTNRLGTDIFGSPELGMVALFSQAFAAQLSRDAQGVVPDACALLVNRTWRPR
jgi:hypothetical protein